MHTFLHSAARYRGLPARRELGDLDRLREWRAKNQKHHHSRPVLRQERRPHQASVPQLLISSVRQDTAKSAKGGIILIVNKAEFDKARSETMRSEPEQKLDFLMLFVPKLRLFGRPAIEKLDFLFVKEIHTKGSKIIRDGAQTGNVYFVRSGVCRALHPLTGPLAALKAQLTPEEQNRFKHAVMYTLSIPSQLTARCRSVVCRGLRAERDQVD
jgi:hypothetical protein